MNHLNNNTKSSLKIIYFILKKHFPFTFFATILGIILAIPLSKINYEKIYKIFYILHPLHICLSIMTTTAIYKIYHNKHKKIENFKQKIICLLKFISVGFIGSIIISTISDSIIPYLSEAILKMPFKKIHIGFLEEFLLINGFAIFGFIFAYIKPINHISHFFHIFISIFASLFHILMSSKDMNFDFFNLFLIFIFLLIAVIGPCVFSDFIFPIIFSNTKK